MRTVKRVHDFVTLYFQVYFPTSDFSFFGKSLKCTHMLRKYARKKLFKLKVRYFLLYLCSMKFEYLRYKLLYSKMVNNSIVKLQTLSLMADVAGRLIFRVYLLVQKWSVVNLHPTE